MTIRQQSISKKIKYTPSTLTHPVIWLALFVIFVAFFVPFFLNVWNSFIHLDPTNPATFGQFAGIKNYSEVIRSGELWLGLDRSMAMLAITFLQFVASALIGVLLFTLWGKKLQFGMLIAAIIPALTSPTVAGLMARFYFNDQLGPGTEFLRFFGLLGNDQALLALPYGAWVAVALIDFWQWGPICAIAIWYFLTTIPTHIFEIAKIEKIKKIRLYLMIAFPIIYKSMFALLAFRLFWSFRSFDIIHIMTGGGPGTATLTWTENLQRVFLVQQQYGAGAVYILLFQLLSIVVVLAIRQKAFTAIKVVG